MLFHQVREELAKGVSLNNLHLKVTFYARVSTDSKEQLNSLNSQIHYYKNYISKNKNWTYIDGYIDEGLSGSSVLKRKNFLRMINDAKNKKFDLIITKEVSRFSRNLADSIKYTQELMLNDVGVYFQTNGINTYDLNSEFILNMMGSLAQEEVKRLSSRIKWGHQNAIKRGRVLGSNSITGYIKDDAKLIIAEEEAKKVRRIFSLYATSSYSLNTLAIKLYNEGITNNKGNIYTKDSLKRIIENPKYKGYYRGHTTETIDYKTKKRIQIPLEKQVIYKDPTIPSIVSEELWNKANQILKIRSTQMQQKTKVYKKYPLTSKIICFEHNTSYQRTISKRTSKNPRWACCNYLKYGVIKCESPIIPEKDLLEILKGIFNQIFSNKDFIKKDTLSYYNQKPSVSISNQISNLNIKKSNLLELLLSGLITKEEYAKKKNEITTELQRINEKTPTNNDIATISKAIDDKLTFEKNISDLITTFIDKIVVRKIENNRNNLHLTIYLKIVNTSLASTYKTKKNNYSYLVKSL